MSANDILKDILADASIKKMNKNEDLVVIGKEELDEGDVEPLVTPFPTVNLAIGIGGLPKGKIIEISGEEGSYKSAFCWAVAGETQRNGGVVAWIDAENAVDLRIPKVRKFLTGLGVDYENIIIIRPNVAETAFQIVKILAKRGDVDLIVFDSIVALSNQREEDAGMEKTDRNTLAMTINKGLRQCAPLLRKNDCTLLLINQLRANQDAKGPYDKKWTTTGGKGLAHWCSLRMFAFKSKIKNSDKEHIGNVVTYKVEKTRFDNPRDNARLFYYFSKGFSVVEEVLDLAIAWGVLEKSGNSYVYENEDGEVIKYSRKKWLEILEEDKELYEAILSESSELYEEYFSDDESEEDEEGYEEEDEEDDDEYDEDEEEEEDE